MVAPEVWRALIVAGVVSTTAQVVGTLSHSASTEDVVKALAEHGQHPHPPTKTAVEALAEADREHERQLARLEAVPDDIRAIRGRIDLLLQRELEGAQRRPSQMRSIRQSADRVRAAARRRGETGDPLEGLEGL